MNNIDTNVRQGFFPKTKENSKAKVAKSPYLKRNDAVRKSQLDEMAKRDSKVQIPDAVKDFARIKKAVDTAPEIDNTDKIAKLKAQIQGGTYKVDYEGLADKILSSEF